MLDLSREQIEERLLEAMTSARRHYESQETSVDEYLKALKRFSDFIVDGKLPDDLKPKRKPVGFAAAIRVVRKKKA